MKIFLIIAAIVAPVGAIAADATVCATLWPNSHCKTWSLSGGGGSQYYCSCSTCNDGYYSTAWQESGTQTKTSGGYTYSVMTSCLVNTSGLKLCNSSTNPCYAPQRTVNGQIYCASGTATVLHATTAASLSKYCSNGSGVGDPDYHYVMQCEEGYVPDSNYEWCTCDRGYYTSAPYECSRCPSSGGIYGTTANTGNNKITDCYIPSDTSMTDDSGTYVFTSPCYYKQ